MATGQQHTVCAHCVDQRSTGGIGCKQYPHKNTCAVSREIHNSCNVVVTSEEVVTVQFWTYGFLFFFTVYFLVWVVVLVDPVVLVDWGRSFQTVSLNICHNECCLSSLKAARIYKSVTQLFQVAHGTSLASCYAYNFWWDVFITELKQLATPGLSSDAVWQTVKCTDKL